MSMLWRYVFFMTTKVMINLFLVIITQRHIGSKYLYLHPQITCRAANPYDYNNTVGIVEVMRRKNLTYNITLCIMLHSYSVIILSFSRINITLYNIIIYLYTPMCIHNIATDCKWPSRACITRVWPAWDRFIARLQ